MVETPAHRSGDTRLRPECDTQPRGAQHRQVVGPVADGECTHQRDTELGGEGSQGLPLGLAGDDRGQHPSGKAAIDHLKPIGDYMVETELGRDPLGEDRKPAGDERSGCAVAPHRGDEGLRSLGRADLCARLVEDVRLNPSQQRDARFERLDKIDLAVHGAAGDFGDVGADAEDQRQLVEHLVFNDRRFEIGNQKVLAPGSLALRHDVDRGSSDDGAGGFSHRRQARSLKNEIAGLLRGEPDRLGRDRQCLGDRRSKAGKTEIASTGDQSEGDTHRRWSYALKRTGDKRRERNPEPAPPVLIIAGPTASGKSALALAVAADMGGPVINADSLQCYRDLEILTARPGPDAMARAPHRLYGFLDAAERGSAGSWREAALVEIAAATAAGSLPIVVGGTGLYIRALTDGLAPFPEIPEEIRQEAAALHHMLGGAAFRDHLATLDPVAARRLDAGDTQRLVRAYAVLRATGVPIGAWRERAHPAAPYRFATILLMPPREDLYVACDARFAAMIGRGGLVEAATLAGRGLDPDLPAMKAVGLPELMRHLRGETSLTEAVAAAQRATRHYAKRQMTWFRHQTIPGLIIGEQFSESLLHRSCQFIDEFLLTGRA